MNSQDILQKAIEKAIAGGCKQLINIQETLGWSWTTDKIAASYLDNNLYGLIFNHDFAKALWGEELFDDLPHLRQYIPEGWTSYAPKPEWQYHLQQMVIADDPIQYLGEHL